MAFETVMVKVKFQVYVSPSMAPRFRLSLRVRLWSTKFCGTTGLRTFAKIMNVRLDFTRPNMLPAQLNCGRSTEFWHSTFKFLARGSGACRNQGGALVAESDLSSDV